MALKKYVCNICNCNFYIKPQKKYIVKVATQGIFFNNLYDAMDCPQCGCQQLLCIRYPLVDDKNNKKS